MQTNNFKSLSMGVLCALSLAGCMEKDLYQAPEEKTADEYFGFTTSSSCTVDLNYGLNYQVVFELYAENPLSEDKDGNIIKTKEEPVYRGATDKKGIFNDFISIPSYLTELYLYSNYLGTVSPIQLQITNGKISFDQKAFIQSKRNAKGTSRGVTNSGYKYPEGFQVLGEWNEIGCPTYLSSTPTEIDGQLMYNIREVFIKPGGSAAMEDYYPEYIGDNVNIDIKAGDFVAVLGHNGSGKSTFAKHLNALVMPTEGTVYVDGMDTKDSGNTLSIRQTAGMVFQNPDNQIVGTLVDEEVGFGPENIGVPTEEIWERVEKSLKAVGMYQFRSASPNKLSGGQKQRVAIAGIVAMKPKCIVLDEPTAMLDPLGRKEVLNVLHELNRKENVTIILITHYMEEVIDADYVYVMDGGKLVMDGTPRQIFTQVEMLKSMRLDVPQVTELAYELKKAGLPIKDGIIRNEELVEELKRLDK